jgi:hypothetical protein
MFLTVLALLGAAAVGIGILAGLAALVVVAVALLAIVALANGVRELVAVHQSFHE